MGVAPVIVLIPFVFGLLLWSASSALAQSNIGSAITIVRDVSGVLTGRVRAVGTGDNVFSSETIRTAGASRAELRFLDDSKLTVGPSTSFVLDRFVYNPDRSARTAAFRVLTGAARWIGGNSESRAYRIGTPHAVIGVRGTAFDLLVEAHRTLVTLREGSIVVCLVSEPRRCANVTAPGQTVLVTRSAIQGPSRTGPSSSRFATACLSAAEGAVNRCATRAFATALATLQGHCLEGRTLSGSCVDADFARLARFRAVVATQPKFSYSTRLVLPGGDPYQIRPFDYFERERGIYTTEP